ncbi:MAG: hypothetical protein JSV90_02170 [Methanobacteriota archaeon]|nr:MAG: hypothetical protein JSV90_02170 [Euryarchaeota archaeon]
MPIKSFELNSMDAKRFTKLGERIPQLRVDQNTAVTSVNVVSDHEALLEFRFMINYVGVGVIKLEGKLVWDGDAKPLASQWSEKHSLPNEVFGPVLAATYANCMPAAVTAARDLGLPPPLPPPPMAGRAGGQQKKGKDHSSSMEVA